MPLKITTHQYDTLIIGAGGAGLRAAVAASANGGKVAIISKVSPTRSHTVAAQGGINAALGNRAKDDWRWHAYDTIKGSDYLADEDAVNFMCEAAPAAIVELEQMGMPFTRDENGKIYQRAYGGQRTDFGQGSLAYRACAVADRTGHSMLHTLYAQTKKAGVKYFVEFIAIDLVMNDDGACTGALVWELDSGDIHYFSAKTTNGWVRASIRGNHRIQHLHRRWRRHGATRRTRITRHGIHPISPDQPIRGGGIDN
jgi:succinate dehydrogenase/fumarate reductase flavoprotein subunit